MPTYAIQNPSLYDVVVTASVDTNDGLIQGQYEFQVDDFPDPSIFNADFAVYYSSFANASAQILSTRDNKNVITRPNNGTNSFVLCALNDIIPYLPDGSIVWNTSGSLIYGNVPNNINIVNPSYNYVTLSALSATVDGWEYPHSVCSSVNFYILVLPTSTNLYSLMFIQNTSG
jgi:hypothetical protein